MKKRKFLSFILFSLILIVVLLEVLLRLTNTIYPLEKPPHLRDQTSTQWLEGQGWLDGENRLYILQPNSQGTTYGHPIRVNRWGFRGKDFLERAEEGWKTFRIMVLGDSTTMGWAIAEEDRYTNILEAKLRARYPGTAIDVINLGIGGHETVQEEKILRRMWPIIQPNLTIVGFSENDPNITYNYYLPYEIPMPKRVRRRLNHLLMFRMAEPLYDRWYRALKNLPTHAEEVDLAYDKDTADWKVFEGSAKRIADFVRAQTGQSPLLMYLTDVETQKNKGHYAMVRDTFEQSGFIWVETESGHYATISRFEGHPNEDTHRYFAHALFDKIVQLHLIEEWAETARD